MRNEKEDIERTISLAWKVLDQDRTFSTTVGGNLVRSLAEKLFSASMEAERLRSQLAKAEAHAVDWKVAAGLYQDSSASFREKAEAELKNLPEVGDIARATREEFRSLENEIAALREVTWPDFRAPAQYENPAEGWDDPKLPDFRLIWKAARDCGYAIGLHGSMKRDCDLIAAPWIDSATSAEELINTICYAINAKQLAGSLERKPQGRIALTLLIDGWFKPIDLSIMPRAANSDEVGTP
jgi:hypothetical protein